MSIPAVQTKFVSIQEDASVNSRVLVLSNNTKSSGTLTTAYQALASRYSTHRIKFKISKGKQMTGGIIVSATKNGSQVITSGYKISVSANAAKNINVNVSKVGSPPNSGYNMAADIDPDKWYELTVTTSLNNRGKDYINVNVAGVSKTVNFVAGGVPYTVGYALFSRSSSRVAFDWIGAGNGVIDSGQNSQRDAISNILRGVASNTRSTAGYFQNFGDTVREVYVETVRFSKNPAVSVQWYPSVNFASDNTITGPNIASMSEISAGLSNVTPFSARLAIANVGSRSVYLDTIDSNLYPLVYGSIVETQQEIEVEKKNADSIRKFGENKIDLGGQWITTRAAADNLCEWVIDIMADGREIHEIDTFDNPLIEIGDVVDIDYDAKGLTTTSKYLVQAVSRSWSDGLETSVKLVKL
jgi:hypothetical protein